MQVIQITAIQVRPDWAMQLQCTIHLMQQGIFNMTIEITV